MDIIRRFFSGSRIGRHVAGEGLQEALQAGWLPEALLKPLMDGTVSQAQVQAVTVPAAQDVGPSDWLSRFYANQSC